jgi:simple sugar transport system permease protein
MKRINTRYLLTLGLSIVSALLLGAVILLLAGFNPLEAYAAIWEGAVGSARHVGDFLEYAMVLCLCGLACVLAARVGIFNVGGEGQLLLGAIVSCQVGVWMQGSAVWLVLPCAALAAMAVGGGYAFVPGILKVKLKVNEVITTIMLNTVAACLCQYLAKGPWKNANKNMVAATEKPDMAYWLDTVIAKSKLSTAIFSAIVITLILWFVLSRTAKGYELRLTGENPRFALFSGIRTERLMLICMVLSGALCGLVGMFRVYGAEHIYKSSVSNDYYFEGLMIAMIAGYKSLPVVGLSVFFAMLKIGADELQYIGIPSQIYLIIQTVVIFCMAAQSGLLTVWSKRKGGRRHG